MTESDLYDARNELLDHLGTSVNKPATPWTPDEHRKQRDWASRAAGLAAQFVAALEKASGGANLDQRFTKLANITGLGSPYQFARDDAFQRLMSLKEASPDDKVERVPKSKLVMAVLPEYAQKDFLDWKKVEGLVGSVESILWQPYELGNYWCQLAESTKYRELPDFTRELRRVLDQMKAEHLWGSFLLAVSSSVRRAAQPDWCFLLEDTIMRSEEAVQAITDAVDDLFVEFHVDLERFKDDERQLGILVAMLRMEAFSLTTRHISDDILKVAFGSVGDRNVFSLLRDKGLICSKGGSGGGCWLTPVGRSIAKKLRDQGVRIAGDAVAPASPGSGNLARTETSAPAIPAQNGGSATVMKKQNGPSGSKPVAAKSPSKKKVDRQSWNADMWVHEFLAENPGATENAILAHVVREAPRLSPSKINDAINDRSRVRKDKLPSGEWGYVNR